MINNIMIYSIEATEYDILKNIVESKISDPLLISEYLDAYVAVAQSVGLSLTQFSEILQSQGSNVNLDSTLIAYLNQGRVANARLGLSLSYSILPYIQREIQA
jgi:hypothetical protein